MSTHANQLLTRTLDGMDPAEHARLLTDENCGQVPASLIEDPDWMSEQLRLRGRIWNTDDARVLATLWWFSTSTRLITPSVASFVVTGEALSPRLEDLWLHWHPDSRLSGVTSVNVLTGSPALEPLAAGLRRTLERSITSVAATARIRHRPLWAIATDAIAGCLLWAGRARGTPESATALAEPLVAAIDAPMPAPRYTEIDSPSGTSRLFTKRTSCCLLYRAPGEDKCSSCPGRPPEQRHALLRENSPH
ncbi:FhuF 2Fe-2S C-terminal domain-containing protein [Actinopolyspora xinjiangensis]|uniref:FhuF 2Fe-2S C-terminal domain-containing protein n=1 Tax=Actinopolyspora xinjiangensis TaxID=405564 RepID=A0A1H0WZ00_9ACTN|nr:(2Fe-2S)-binding protein [Actinopolyspora xinjiangensis]SDP95850.1 FhuF 2Fe-2S C-terminal domain-containing protein [Actinopolyspora xinjiangensis]